MVKVKRSGTFVVATFGTHTTKVLNCLYLSLAAVLRNPSATAFSADDYHTAVTIGCHNVVSFTVYFTELYHQLPWLGW